MDKNNNYEIRQKELKRLAIQAKRRLTLENKKTELNNNVPACPTLLSLAQLSRKTGLSYTLLHRMVIDCKFVPYFRVGRKYLVNYDVFLKRLNNEEGRSYER